MKRGRCYEAGELFWRPRDRDFDMRAFQVKQGVRLVNAGINFDPLRFAELEEMKELKGR